MYKTVKILLAMMIIAAVVSFFAFDLGQFFNLAFLKSRQQTFAAYYANHRLLTISIYFIAYVAMAALSLPGAAVMSLAGGALFGLAVGSVVISFASSIGAALAFLVSRFVLRDSIQRKFGDKLTAINEGIRKDGAFYLFTLRLVPVFPFFIINLVMGLTPLRITVFYIVSQLGMLPATLVYVNAGTQLGKLESLKGILSPGLILSFVLLGIFPFIAKVAVGYVQRRKIYRKWCKPKHFDYNMVVIGAGSAGLVAAYIGAAVKAKTALIEKHRMGGDCLNTGCVPSKALLRSAKMMSYARRAKAFGLRSTKVDFDFGEVMERVQRVVENVAPHDSIERYTDLGVDVIQGEGQITSPFTVQVGDRTLTTRTIVVATGAAPLVPPIPGLQQVPYLTSDNLWQLRRLPGRLIVLGGGPIGCEMAQAFARFGAQVTQVEMAQRLLSREDEDISTLIGEAFKAEGLRLLLGHRAKAVEISGEDKQLICEGPSGDVAVPFDDILVALGRKANTAGFGLETLDIDLRPNGTVETNGLLQTNYPNIYCAGDVTGPYQFTHTASHQSWYAAVNALFGRLKTFAVDYRVIPWCTFTDPEVARVGLNIQEAEETHVPYEVTEYRLEELDRAIADSDAHGLVRILTKPGSDKILGVTIVGPHAGDLIAEYILAMKHDLGLNKIMGTIHIYPTLAEANKAAAGVWKKAHAPQRLLAWVARYHAWMRS